MNKRKLNKQYNPTQSLNNIRYNYFTVYKQDHGEELEYFWFNRVAEAIKEKEKLEKKYRNLLKKYEQLRKYSIYQDNRLDELYEKLDEMSYYDY